MPKFGNTKYAISSRFAQAVLVVLLGYFSIGIAAAADPDLKQAEALIRGGKPAEAYALLAPFEDDQAGDPTFDYLLATAALNSGQPSKASFIYERILAVQPDYVGARADMGRAYFAMENFARAKIEFETVLTFQNTPPDIKSSAQQYLSAIEQRLQGKKTVAVGYVELGFGHDSNINGTTAGSPLNVNGFPFFLDAKPTGARYWQLGAGGEINHQLSEKVGVYTGADVRGRVYNDHNDANYDSADGHLGLSYSSGATLYRAGVTTGRYILDSNGTIDNRGVTADLRHAVNNSNQLLLSGAYNAARYQEPGANINDYNLASLSLGWTRAIGTAIVINGAVNVNDEHAVNGRDDGDRKFYGVRFTFQAAMTEKVSGFLVMGFQKSNYENQNPSFLLLRGDQLVDATLGISWRFADRWTARPAVSMIKNNSNIGLDEFKRTDVSFTLRRDFY